MVMLVYQRVSHKSGEHLESANNLYGSIKGENLQETMDLRPKSRGYLWFYFALKPILGNKFCLNRTPKMYSTESRFLWNDPF